MAAGVAIISPTVALPGLTDAGTTIDGETQTTNVGNTNSVTLGTGGTVGVDALPLPTVAGPEVEIRAGAPIGIGLLLQAMTSRSGASLFSGSATRTARPPSSLRPGSRTP